MKEKHTPGPWTIREHPTQLTIMSERGRICVVSRVARVADSWANARLIALAPNMYETLKMVPDAIASSDVYYCREVLRQVRHFERIT